MTFYLRIRNYGCHPPFGARIIASAPREPQTLPTPLFTVDVKGQIFVTSTLSALMCPPYVCQCFYRRVNNVCSFRRKITVIMTIVAMLGYDHSTAVTVNSYDS